MDTAFPPFIPEKSEKKSSCAAKTAYNQKGVPMELLFSLVGNLGNAPTAEPQVSIDPIDPKYCLLQSLSATVYANQLQRSLRLADGVNGRFRPHARVDGAGYLVFEAAFIYERSERAEQFVEQLPALLPKYWEQTSLDQLKHRSLLICKPWQIALPFLSPRAQAA
jgi:hypothetical protein